MSSQNLGFVKQEILFFMEKTFHFSYVYIAAAVGLLLFSSGTDGILKNVAQITSLREDILFFSSVLTLNLVYLIAMSSCLFSVIKRGLFVLEQCQDENPEPPVAEWERFMRDGSRLGIVGWNS